MKPDRRQRIAAIRRRWIAVAIAGAVAVAALIVTMVQPFGPPPHRALAHSDKSSPVAMPPIPPIPPIAPRYGAIAVADNGAVGKTWGHRKRAQAEIHALTTCGHPSCNVLSVFTRCGAIAHDGQNFHGGLGRSHQAAGHDAKARLGGGWVLTSACN
ncbi:putative secreted protein [Mycobacterium liflandii 128FXT]|uniref:DUF4189 domain-containing protein n=3 Tax=Mycobacteriaceae TaxID=1762 RepID=A0A9N7QQ89_9MYCO|nr:DUF4189 domain-containing protein [Mycobacterium pseudoshottsii]AGC64428.1 putative secreted protein [Mycobacterium liflandii 128FXT]BBA90181.1 hypothetical protein MPSD_48890 [Mycobacterium pseudoshottsii JCM 15466]BDN84620.1 hypothetical protein NJB1907Z4_C48350 [Mycobacterium pseudoshottsii]BEH79007.1 hypothetical protein YM3MPS_48100 [Mycobacterium pseudoshottsii]